LCSMSSYDIKIDLLEFYDLIEYTLSFKFRDKWKDLFSERMIKLFQLKILQSFKAGKVIKKTALVNYLANKGKYRKEVIEDFLEIIDLELYRPFISF
jgi:hypothetical protein